MKVTDEWDESWWMLIGSGNFTVSSAWNLLRQKGEQQMNFEKIWVKGLSFNISFFLWRLWKDKTPIDEVLAKMGFSVVSRYVLFTSTPKNNGIFISDRRGVC